MEIKTHSAKESGRKLRNRERRRYTEEFADEEIEGKRMFSVEEKLFSDDFDSVFAREMRGEELNLKYFQEHGFDSPILVKSKTGLGIKMPEKSFNVNDVKQLVGSRRVVDVMDVSTQKNIEMTVKEWCRYYENPKRDRLLNIISLEFSHTKLETMVESPTIVRQVDWVDWVWPKHLKHLQTESTNSIDDMKYPKVQKYCLMSVKGCYTDFHIDFGGTSVWYHILKGQKVFWLIPPSERNIQLYEQWVLSGKQTDVFFGDTVDQCSRIWLNEGFTFFIPTGWIHAVYTPEDSLVFGGNFLHSFGIEKQLRIAQVEDITKVPSKFRYPFYSEILWYVLQRYVYCLTGKNHLNCNEDGVPFEDSVTSGTLSSYSNHVSKPKNTSEAVHLTQFELNGLKAIIMWLSRLSSSKRSVPELISNPEALLNDAKLLVDDHTSDDSRQACTGKSVLFWSSKIQKPVSTFTSASSSSHSGLSVTAQLRQIKNNSYSSALKHSTSKLSFTHNTQGNDGSPKRPESPPTRPLSSNQYAVSTSTSKSLDQIPSSFAQLIAATEVGNQNRATIGSIVNNKPLNATSTTSTMTQTAPLNVQTGHNSFNQDIVSSIISKDINSIANNFKPNLNNGNNNNNQNNQNIKNASASDSSRRRRTRCKKCESCLRADCGDCHFCKDMKKFGGPGRMKQSCIARQCMAPVLPHTACCMICGRDGWEKLATTGVVENETQSSLMECSKCWEIAHPICLKEKGTFSMNEGIISEELPNSWECPKCVILGKQGLCAKQRPGKIQSSPVSSVSNATNKPVTSFATLGSSDSAVKKARLESSSNDDDESMTKPSDDETNDESSGSDSSLNNIDVSENMSTENPPSTTSSPVSPPCTSISSNVASHIKSCARFPLLQEAIKQQQEQQQRSSSSASVKYVKVQQELKSALLKTKRSNESSRDRLFRSLKGLKKSSEMRFSSLGNHSQLLFVSKKSASRPPQATNSQKSEMESNNIASSDAFNFPFANNKESKSKSTRNSKDAVIYDDDTDNETDENETNNVSKEGAKYTSSSSSPSSSSSSSDDEYSVENSTKKVRLEDGVLEKGNHQLLKPKYVVRPAPLPEDISETEVEDNEGDGDENSDDEQEKQKVMRSYLKKLRRKKKENLSLERDVILPVLPYLCRKDLINCMLVCKVWNGWCLDPKLWKKLDLTRKKITSNSLMGLVRRQPVELNLSWSDISKRQLSWLLARLPQLQMLSLAGCSSSIVNAFCTCNCPLMKVLDLSWVDSLCDTLIREILSPPLDSRPGLMETKTRLRHLTDIRLAGSEISDISIRLMSHHLPQLTSIDLSNCQKVTDMGIAVLGAAKSSKLTSLKLASCGNISDTSLDALKRCQNLKHLDVRDCNQVSINGCHKLMSALSAKTKLVMKQPKLLELKSS